MSSILSLILKNDASNWKQYPGIVWTVWKIAGPPLPSLIPDTEFPPKQPKLKSVFFHGPITVAWQRIHFE